MTYLIFIVKSALFDFTRNKMRTFLTSLGILIGIMSVILLLAFGLGLRTYIQQEFESLGSNLIYVLPGSFGNQKGGFSGFRPGSFGAKRFDENDLHKLERIKEAKGVVAAFVKTVTVTAGGDEKLSDLFAANAEVFSVQNFEISTGRLFNKSDVNKRSKVAVLGPKIAVDLYKTEKQAIGKTIKAENQAFKVIGVLKAKGGGFGGPDIDSFIYVPYSSATALNPDKKFIRFGIQARTSEDIPLLKEHIKDVLGKRYKKDDFSVFEQSEILSTITSVFGVINTILVAIGAISLVVGGVGIMNIMYVSVTERIKEIGIRRAVGARRKDILFQFLTESIILCLIGGILALILSSIIVFFIHPYFPASIHPIVVAIAIGVSSGVGILFGVFPAKRAADLSPIDAIRYE